MSVATTLIAPPLLKVALRRSGGIRRGNGPPGVMLQYPNVTKYIRYQFDSAVSYGILEGETVREIHGDLLGGHAETGVTHPLSQVQLLHPCEPGKILAVGLNYKSHLGGRPQPAHPEMFYKPVSALQDPEGPIVIPRDSTDLHYEGRTGPGDRQAGYGMHRARKRGDAIFGVTCGNDVSERNWQHGQGKDLQWWRAKGCDTFAPLGPAIVTGIDYGNLLLQTRLNGEVVQKQTTADLIFDVPPSIELDQRLGHPDARGHYLYRNPGQHPQALPGGRGRSGDRTRRHTAQPGQLEADLRTQLQTAPAARSGDVTVVGVGDVGGRVVELRSVGDAERLTADFHFHLLREVEDLEDGKIRVEEARPGKSIPSGTPEAHTSGLDKAGLGEPGASALARRVDAVQLGDFSNLVGSLVGARRVEHAAVLNVMGVPVMSVRMPLICQPPIVLAASPWFSHLRPTPNGRS